jgi:hypothetical protein
MREYAEMIVVPGLRLGYNGTMYARWLVKPHSALVSPFSIKQIYFALMEFPKCLESRKWIPVIPVEMMLCSAQ